jgi:cytochrome c553
MAGFAGALSKQDIENVAAYFESQPPVVYTKF